MNTFIPISLVVTLEVCKVFQASYIQNDWELFSKEPAAVEQSPTPKVGQTNIIEELGQISYIFSDKTGTLTRNEMSMKAFCIGNDKTGQVEDGENWNIGEKPLNTLPDTQPLMFGSTEME